MHKKSTLFYFVYTFTIMLLLTSAIFLIIDIAKVNSLDIAPPSIEQGNDNVILPENNQDNSPLTPLVPAKEYLLMVKSKTNGLTIRSKPTTQSAPIGSINKNDLVAYKGQTNGWYITKYRNQTAYISASTKYTELLKFDKPNNNINSILQIGLNLLGTPYIYGAERYHWGNGVLNTNFDINAFDCSSFTQYIFYKSHYIMLDTTSRTQSIQGKTVTDKLRVGDVMFFTNSSRVHLTGINRVGHVGIYFGNNYILHTASDYAVVEPISNTRWGYYLHSKRFV